jgi:hypothetical protein
MVYSGAGGTLIHEKKMRSKISCQTPFKECNIFQGISTACSCSSASVARRKRVYETNSVELMPGALKSLKIRPQAFSPFTHTYVLGRTLVAKAEMYCAKDRAA